MILQEINEITETADTNNQTEDKKEEEVIVKTVDSAEKSTDSDGSSNIHPIPFPRTNISKVSDNAIKSGDSDNFESDAINIEPTGYDVVHVGKNPFDEDTKSENERYLFRMKYYNFTIVMLYNSCKCVN